MKKVPKGLIIVAIIVILIIVVELGAIINILIIEPLRYQNSSHEHHESEAMINNNKFNQYFGIKVSAADVKALLQEISANNVGANYESDSKKKIYLRGIGNTPEDAMAVIVEEKRYVVNVTNDEYSQSDDDENDNGTGYYSSGYIKTIKIIPNEE